MRLAVSTPVAYLKPVLDRTQKTRADVQEDRKREDKNI